MAGSWQASRFLLREADDSDNTNGMDKFAAEHKEGILVREKLKQSFFHRIDEYPDTLNENQEKARLLTPLYVVPRHSTLANSII